MVGGPGHALLTVDLVAEPSDTKSSGFEPNGSSGVSLVSWSAVGCSQLASSRVVSSVSAGRSVVANGDIRPPTRSSSTPLVAVTREVRGTRQSL